MRLLTLRFTVPAVLLLFATPVLAQQRPLVTEDPETIGAGRVLIEGGIEYDRNAQFPVSGHEGHLLRFPLLGVSVGISSIAELQVDGGLHDRLTVTRRDPNAPLASMVTATGPTDGDVEDTVVATKIRIIGEGMTRPSFGIRFATRLPNANNETGIGIDTYDFYAQILMAKTVQSVRVVGNLGLGILGDPIRGDRQNDVTMYGLSFARAVTNKAEVVGEINGYLNTRSGVPPVGTDSRGIARFGGRYTIGSWRADANVLFGVTSRDPNIGFGAGFTYVFNAFKIP
jgi:hypothetical protein